MMLAVADERGAVLAMVAVMLVAILGMLALVVDVGAMFVTKRQVVAAADSASLAAAQSCALEDGEAKSQADAYATFNKNEATPIFFSGCEGSSSGTVAVAYGAASELLFAPIVGLDDSASVEASSTGLWGPAGRAEPIPVIVNLNDPRSCSPCPLWLDPLVVGGFTGGEAGLVDLDRWDGGGCRRSSSRLFDWISGASSVHASLPATPCGVTDVNTEDLVSALLGQSGEVKVFPVASGSSGGRRGRRFSAVGFAPLRVDDAVLASQGFSDVPCEARPENHSFLGRGDTHSINDEVLACKLLHDADSVTVQLRRGRRCCSQPVDYVFNPATNVITWNTEETEDVSIQISWSKLPDSGGCGERDVTGNEICLVVSWQGPRVGGSRPAEDGANDYGYRAVRLKD